MRRQLKKNRSSSPASIEESPKKRICPSDIWVIRRKVSRHRVGARKGSRPSMTNIRANASRKVVPVGPMMHLFLAGLAAGRILHVPEEFRAGVHDHEVAL